MAMSWKELYEQTRFRDQECFRKERKRDQIFEKMSNRKINVANHIAPQFKDFCESGDFIKSVESRMPKINPETLGNVDDAIIEDVDDEVSNSEWASSQNPGSPKNFNRISGKMPQFFQIE